MRFTIWLLLLACTTTAFGCVPKRHETASVRPPGTFILLDAGEVARARALVRAGELTKAMTALTGDCAWALTQPNPSVAGPDKSAFGLDVREYASLAPDHQADSETPDGLPWRKSPGVATTVTPERKALEAVCDQASNLALAYALTGKEAYAVKAAKLVRVFFMDPATRMNPNLEHAHMIPGLKAGRASGIVESRGLLKLVDVPGLLAGSKAWTPNVEKGLRDWCADYLDWLETSRAGRQALQSEGGLGVWADALVAGLGLLCGRDEEAGRALERAVSRLDALFDEDGLQPEAVKGPRSLQAHLATLEAWTTAALAGRKLGVNLWETRTASGRSFRPGVDALLPFLRGDKPWPHMQIRELTAGNYRQIALVLRLAAIAYGEQGYEDNLRAIAGSVYPALRVNLTFPWRR